MSFFERLETQDGWQAFWRPVMAYCMASYGAGVVLLLFWRRGPEGGLVAHAAWLAQTLYISLPPAFIGALLAVIPTILIGIVLQESRLRRGVAEMVIGAVMGPPLSFFMLIGPSMVSSVSVGFWRSLSWRAWPSLTAIVLIGAITGAMAGLAYWLAVGRLQNPRAR